MKFNKIIISSDIDGVMNNYPICFLEYLEKYHNLVFETKEIAKSTLKLTQYKLLKSDYRNSEFKYKISYCNDIINLYKKFNKYGIPIIFSTSRPFKKYPNMYDKTYKWLSLSGIHFNGLFPKTIKTFHQHKITHHIDDELSSKRHLLMDATRPMKIILLDRSGSINKINTNDFEVVRNTDDIQKILEIQEIVRS
jgi:hypothetical protein